MTLLQVNWIESLSDGRYRVYGHGFLATVRLRHEDGLGWLVEVESLNNPDMAVEDVRQWMQEYFRQEEMI